MMEGLLLLLDQALLALNAIQKMPFIDFITLIVRPWGGDKTK